MILTEHQRLATSGARGVTYYTIGSVSYLAIPQLARDIPGTPPHMNGGDSDVVLTFDRVFNASRTPETGPQR